MTFKQWFESLDKLGIKERLFDKSDIILICPGSHIRRPYGGNDGFFFQCFESGMTPRQALGESMVEQDCE